MKQRKFARGGPTNAERDASAYPFTKTEFRRFRKYIFDIPGSYKDDLNLALAKNWQV